MKQEEIPEATSYEELKQQLAEARAMIGRVNNLKPAGVFRGQAMKINGDVRYVEVEWLKTVNPNDIIYSEPVPSEYPFESAVSGLRYNAPEACGEVAAIHIGGKRFKVASEQSDQDAADAARYRWLKEHGCINEPSGSKAVIGKKNDKARVTFGYSCSAMGLDALIDAAINNEEEKEIN